MGKIDTAAKNCLKNNKFYADVFNFILRQQGSNLVIDPADLYEIDSQQLLILRAGRALFQKQRIRDLVRVWIPPNRKPLVLILGLEIQAAIHYALPVRVMMYDALSYVDQVDLKSKSSQVHITADKDGLKIQLSSDEFLSGFQKGENFWPVITVTVYLGEKPWDAPLTVHEMLGNDEELCKVVRDYGAYLIDPHQMEESSFEGFSTEIGDALRVLKYRDEQYAEQVAAYIEKNPDLAFNAKTGELLLACGIQFTSEAKKKMKKGEDVPMCASISALIREGEIRGEQRADQRVKEAEQRADQRVKEAEQRADQRVKEAEQNTVQYLISLMNATNWKLPKAMDALSIPKNMRPKYGKLVKAALSAQAGAATVS